jgi:hypothetical protein
MKRTGKTIEAPEEKAGRLQEALVWYENSGNQAEADQVKLKQVNTNPDNVNTVNGAIGAEGLAKKSEAVNEKAETKRQDKFKKDQKSLEKELGL